MRQWWRRTAIFALLLPLLSAGLHISGASAANKLTASEAREKLERQQRSLDAARQRQSHLKRNAQVLARERARLNSRLIETAALVRRSESKLTKIEGRLGELEVQEKLIRGSLQQQHGTITKLLSAMQRMGRNPPPVMVTRRKDALAMVRSAMLLASVFPEMKEKALSLSSKLTELVRVLDEARAGRDKLRAENKRLIASRLKVKTLLATKRLRITKNQAELEQVRLTAVAYANRVSSLNELLKQLDKTVAEKAGLGAYERELARGEAPGQKNFGLKGPVKEELALAFPKPGDLAGENSFTAPKVQIKPTKRKFAFLSPSRLKPALPFAKAKGTLPMPVNGRRIMSFGDKTRIGGRSKGVALETRPHAQITSLCDGWIVYAGRFRSYGQLLIINAGGGYHVLLAGMSRIDVALGQFVLKGEPVGTMGAKTRSAQNKARKIAPVLYVEFRKKGRPVNPNPWWVVRTGKVQKVQG